MIYLIGFKSCFAFILLDNSIDNINYTENKREKMVEANASTNDYNDVGESVAIEDPNVFAASD